jgi:hypothetical protein
VLRGVTIRIIAIAVFSTVCGCNNLLGIGPVQAADDARVDAQPSDAAPPCKFDQSPFDGCVFSP